MFASLPQAFRLACFAFVAALALAPAAKAQDMVGYSLNISEGINVLNLSPWLTQTQLAVAADRPLIQITNLSTSADITDFTLSLANTTFSFGSLIFLPPSLVNVTDFSPGDTPGLHAGLGVASLDFANFSPTRQFGFRVDLDRNSDHGASLTNFRDALVGGSDSSHWATLAITFSDGTVMHDVISPEDLQQTSVSLTGASAFCGNHGSPGQQIVTQNTIMPIPEPSTLVLAAIGVAGFAGAARSRRRRPQSKP